MSSMSLDSFAKKFKQRQEDQILQQALVYLKLRQYQCNNHKAILFAKKLINRYFRKQKAIDGTLRKDGPSICRKLTPLKSQRQLVNGWLRGQKLKYKGAIGYSKEINENESKSKMQITAYNSKIRQQEKILQKNRRTKSVLTFNIKNGHQTIQKINGIKQQLLKDSQKDNVCLKLNDTRLYQTTKQFSKDIKNVDTNGLIVKLGAFNDVLNDQRLEIQLTPNLLKTQTQNSIGETMKEKRQKIEFFQKTLSQYKDIKRIPSKFRNNKNLTRKISHSFFKNTAQRDKNQQFYENVEKIAQMSVKESHNLMQSLKELECPSK